MAKKKDNTQGTERLVYCSGPNWEGDGSKETSLCKFNDSMVTAAERYKCFKCCTNANPTVVATKEPEVIAPKEPTVVGIKEPTVVRATEPEVIATKEPTVVGAKEPTVVGAIASKRKKKRHRF